MSTENDVPLGEGSRRYYEQQFGDRIHEIKKGGSSPRRDSGSPNWSGRAGCGGLLAVIFIVRFILIFIRTQSSTPSYNYTPSPQFNAGMQQPLGELDVEDEEKILLAEADVPLLEGLCYRIQQESRQPQPTPGKRLYLHLPFPAQQSLNKAAGGERLGEAKRHQLFQALNALLHDEALYDAPSFHNVPGVATLMLLNAQGTPRFNRLLLEKCYPEQIVPLDQHRPLNAWAQAQWKQRPQRDLNKARQKYEP